ncbi:MAG TPA: SRPBCC family protein [Isosphaeraceae bacterium]|nr:SRPBCC family protein [Isosphaeraceae bacterium]
MKFIKESHLSASPSTVFAFHESPGALQRLTPPGEKLQVVEGGHSLKPGSRVVLRMSLGPFPITWVAEHVDYDPPHLFSDRQISGPFASWYHKHQFLDAPQGGTILRDEVDFSPPLGILGRFLGGWLLRRKLQTMFDFRHDQTRRILESGDSP